MAENENEKFSIEDQELNWKKIISTLQDELNMKNAIITNTEKDKHRLNNELKKIKRVNINLKQQLEDERAFYMKEKEYYCREMCINKKMRKIQNEDMKIIEDVSKYITEIDNLKKDITKLKQIMNETLEANYNLSIKFLRMKNTKFTLKARYRKDQTEKAKIITDLTQHLENMTEEISHITSEKFMQNIPPSNKKYLQVVKQNTQLIHDNLNFQIQISKLINDVERIKADKIKYETNLRLQYSKKLKDTERNDKICEANLCESCSKINNLMIKEKPSNCTISTSTDDSDQYFGTELVSFQKVIIERINSTTTNISTEASDFDSNNT